jgi:excisionase family DNA binding protein
MARRGRSSEIALTNPSGGGSNAVPSSSSSSSSSSFSAGASSQASSTALLYTAQDVAHFCEVDLKTIHHWADAGKIPHHRTDGRHLRFRRNHLVRFLEAHGYPLHSALTSARPSIFVALPQLNESATAASSSSSSSSSSSASDDASSSSSFFKRLSARFAIRRFESAIVAIANLALGEPDALIFALDDTSWSPPATIAALKSHVATSHPAIVVVTGTDRGARENDAMGADLVLPDLTKLPTELAKLLRVD